MPPGHAAREGNMNIMEWMQMSGYIRHKMASIYLNNYDGVDLEKPDKMKEKYNLPDSFIRFGGYNTTGLVKDETIYFWTMTS